MTFGILRFRPDQSILNNNLTRVGLFLLIWPNKVGQKTCWIFQICKDCDHEKMKIPKFND